MIPFLKYLQLTIVHKWFVFVIGIKFKVPIWRLIIHDWTKLVPKHTYQYGKQFFGNQDDPHGFVLTWLKHQNAHDHHWEYWIPRTGHNRSSIKFQNNEPLEMKNDAVREMIADWFAASRAYNGKWPTTKSDWVWYKNNFKNIQLHPNTRQLVNELLNIYL